MTYLGYVVAAYAVFAVVLLWDIVAPILRIRRILRDVRMRARRAAARGRSAGTADDIAGTTAEPTELQR
jgi:heme exporter protein D